MTDDVARRRSTIFFVWMAAFIAMVALIGFIPAIALFVFAYMRFGFGEPWLPFARLCRGDDARLLSSFSTGRSKSRGRRRCWAIYSRRCARIHIWFDAASACDGAYCAKIAAAFLVTSGGVW